MTDLIDPNQAAPDPLIPEWLPDPCSVEAADFQGDPWTWDPVQVALIRSPRTRTLMEQMHQLSLMYTSGLFRALNAAEMAQIAARADEIPSGWQRRRGGRVFFGGTVYDLKFVECAEQSLIPYMWHEGEWESACTTLHIPLRDEDRFACIPLAGSHVLSQTPPLKPHLPREGVSRRYLNS